MGISQLGACGRREWVATIVAAVGKMDRCANRPIPHSREAEQVFCNERLLLLPDRKHSDKEQRFHALGKTQDGRLLYVSFTLREGGKLIRVISARDMHRKERMFYGKAKKEDSWFQNGSREA